MRFHRAIAALTAFLLIGGTVSAQKRGGTLRVYHRDSPASMSIYEETTLSTSMPMMGVFITSSSSTRAKRRTGSTTSSLTSPKAGR